VLASTIISSHADVTPHSDLIRLEDSFLVSQGVKSENSQRDLLSPLPSGPKLYLYVWAGSRRPSKKRHDLLVTLNATGGPDSYDFGNVLSITNMPTFGDEPHHVGLSRDGTVLAVGNLWAYRQNNPDMYFLDVATDPSRPKLLNGAYGLEGSVTDSFLGIEPVGGKPAYLVSLMGNKQGGSPGRLGEINFNNVTNKYEVVREWPGGVNGTVDDSFVPHGYDRNGPTGTVLVSVDYVDISSSFKPTDGIRKGTYVRIWDFSTRTVIRKYDLGKNNSEGLMSVRWTGIGQKFLFSAGLGSYYLLDAQEPFADGVNPKSVYSFGDSVVRGSCVFSPIFKSSPSLPVGDRLIVTSLSLGQVRILNVTDHANPKTLQILQLEGRKAGGHVVIIDNVNNATLVAVSTYYVEQRGKLNGLFTTSTKKQVHLFKIATDKNTLSLVKTIDFKTLLKDSHGVTQPHGMAFKAFTVA